MMKNRLLSLLVSAGVIMVLLGTLTIVFAFKSDDLDNKLESVNERNSILQANVDSIYKEGSLMCVKAANGSSATTIDMAKCLGFVESVGGMNNFDCNNPKECTVKFGDRRYDIVEQKWLD